MDDFRAERPKVGDLIAGKYRIEKVLGEGGMGAVFGAEHLLTSKRVAIKWMLAGRQSDQKALERFRREARAAGRINHPNVVTIFDLGEDGRSTYMVMERLEGKALSSLLSRGAMEPEDAAAVLVAAMRGVGAAHAHGVLHRDLKPENIFLHVPPQGDDLECKVLDFGISKILDERQKEITVTQTGTVVGTPRYMAPEQVRSMKDLDERVDVYAMGVILYELVTGSSPFASDTYGALMVEIATKKPRPPRQLCPELSPELEKVILRAMAKERKDRYGSIADFKRELEPFARSTPLTPDFLYRRGEGHPDSSRPTAIVDQSLSVHLPMSSKEWKVAAVVGIGMMLAALSVVAFWGGSDSGQAVPDQQISSAVAEADPEAGSSGPEARPPVSKDKDPGSPRSQLSPKELDEPQEPAVPAVTATRSDTEPNAVALDSDPAELDPQAAARVHRKRPRRGKGDPRPRQVKTAAEEPARAGSLSLEDF